jgi:cyclase
MTLRVWLLATFGLLLGIGLLLGGSSQQGTVKQIAPGVWFREGERSEGHCNNIFVEMKDYLVVIDANYPSGAQACIRDLKRISSKPVKYVFDTHHHGDHAYGNPVWTKMGAITLAHIGVTEEMKRYEPAGWLKSAKARKDVAELNLQDAERPMETFSKTPYILKDSTREIRFYHFGWAHTRGDAFAYLPKEKVLCTGDAAVNGPHNFIGQGYIRNWPKVLMQVQKLDAVHVLPGHGPAGGPEVLKGQIAFLTELVNAVEKEIRAGKRMQDVVNSKGELPTWTKITLSNSVQNWVGRLPGQVRETWEEISQDKPHGEIVGGK